MNFPTKEQMEFIAWVVGVISAFFAASAAVVAVFQYRRSVRQHIAESLMDLERTFKDLGDIKLVIDPANQLYEKELKQKVTKCIAEPPIPRAARKEDNQLAQLDQFLRFLLLLSSLRKFALLHRKALAHMYHYWFAAVLQNPDLKKYVELYFPNLNKFLEENRKTFVRKPVNKTA